MSDVHDASGWVKFTKETTNLVRTGSTIDYGNSGIVRNEVVIKEDRESAARAYLTACELKPTPDAVDQLTEVFLPCLKIMCERPWDPNGGTWRRAGRFGILTDIRKKFERLWERGWTNGKRHDDSAFDLINYLGMYLRCSEVEPEWGEWGPPGENDR